MKNIAKEITEFIKATGSRQYIIAREAGVSVAMISRLVKGKQQDTLSANASSIRAAMARLARQTPQQE